MKYLLMAQNRLARLREEKGQNTVEYLMIVAVVVGVVLVVGKLIKSQLPGVWQNIMGMITNASSSLGSGG
ncbi:MAG: hypothetical protein KGO96_09920 [Elusimicrobia bacterium]|nr:hypothetical protein [Elusimicrobiota bacterium]MDE2426206.1 hypothetical protein [Elusimicrobiota bacterium]